MSFVLLLSIHSMAQEASTVAIPPPAVADSVNPEIIEADHIAAEQAKPVSEEIKKDPLFLKIHQARYAKVSAAEAEALRQVAVANSDAEKAKRIKDEPVIPVLDYQKVGALPMQNGLKPAQEQVKVNVEKPKPLKTDDSSLDRVSVIMLKGESSATLKINGSQSDVKVGSDVDGISLIKVNSGSQSIVVKHIKSGRSKTISMDSTAPYPASNLKPIKLKDDKK